MTRPRRLDRSSDPFIRDLIGAGRAERPSPRAVARTVVAVSVGASVLTTLKSAAGSIKATVTGASAKGLGGLTVVKWVGLCAVGGMVGTGVVTQVQTESAAPTAALEARPVVPRAPRKRAPAAPVAAPVDAMSTPVIEVQALPLAEAEAELDVVEKENETVAPTPKRAARSARATTKPSRGTDMSAELSFLDAARSALKSQQPRTVLALVREYEQKYPNGHLAPEARYLKMEALWQLGERSAARTAAEQIIVREQGDLHRSRALRIAVSEE